MDFVRRWTRTLFSPFDNRSLSYFRDAHIAALRYGDQKWRDRDIKAYEDFEDLWRKCKYGEGTYEECTFKNLYDAAVKVETGYEDTSGFTKALWRYSSDGGWFK